MSDYDEIKALLGKRRAAAAKPARKRTRKAQSDDKVFNPNENWKVDLGDKALTVKRTQQRWEVTYSCGQTRVFHGTNGWVDEPWSLLGTGHSGDCAFDADCHERVVQRIDAGAQKARLTTRLEIPPWEVRDGSLHHVLPADDIVKRTSCPVEMG